MRYSNKSIRGFTLIEMILYVAICSGLLLSLSLFLTFILGQRVKNEIIQDVNQQGQQVMWLVTQTVRSSRSLDVPAIGSSGGILSVTTGNPLLNPTIFSSNASGTIVIQEGASPSVPLTNSHVEVQSLSFENISSASSPERTLRISFTLVYKNLSGRQEYNYSKTFSGSATLR